MEHSFRGRVLSILSVFLFLAALPSPAYPYDPGNPDLFRSILLVEVPKRGCATAFLLSSGELVTNAHVAEMLCGGGDCSAARFSRANQVGGRPGADPGIRGVRILRMSRAFDLALLQVDWEPATPESARRGVFTVPSPVESGERGGTTHVLGFPRCGPLKHSSSGGLSDGAIISKTSHESDYGSSGSPVFFDDYSIAGVIAEAASLTGALGSMTLGETFSSGVVRGPLVSSFIHDAPEEFLSRQLSELLNLYTRHVLPKRGLERVLSSFEFTVRSDGFKQDLVTRKGGIPRDVAATLSLWSEDSPIFPDFSAYEWKERELLSSLILLTFAYRLENLGAYRDVLYKVDADHLSKSLMDAAAPADISAALQDLFQKFQLSGYPGVLFAVSTYLVLILLVGAVLLAFWGATLGYVVATARGGVLSRVACAVLVGILVWPVSFLVYLAYLARRRRSAA